MAGPEQFIKTRVQPQTFLKILRQLLSGVEQHQEFILKIQGEECYFPEDVLSRANLDIEYERRPDKTELELTIEWRH